MSKRKKASGGQAILMVTISLLAMCGMMGLAVDLGWSFFSQKAAQAAADDAALSAVQRAYRSITSGGGIVTTFSTCGTMNVICAASPVACDPANAGLGNLQSGCLYAKNDGFVPGGHGGRQNVTVQANVPPTFPNAIPAVPSSPTDMVYWVTVRTYESIPQLFSSVMGNSNGAISAVATAAIASAIVPGSFWGMNKQGDCKFNGGTPQGGFTFDKCGVDIDVQSTGSAAPCGAGLPSAYLCAPSGIILSSVCANNALSGCGNSTPTDNGSNYAGNRGQVWGGPVIDIAASNAANGLTTTTPKMVAGNPTNPFDTKPQPPLAASTPIGSCGYPGGVISNTASHLGPYQYYSYTTVGLQQIPDARPIQLPNNATFDPQATGCPGGGTFFSGASQTYPSFPSYIFYGGIKADGVGTVTMGTGQYVFAGNNGNNAVNGAPGGSDNVIATKNTTFVGSGVGNSATDPGVMMILTDAKYPGLSTQMSGIPNWNCTAATCGGTASKIDPAQTDPTTGENWLMQGSIQTKNVNWTMDGYDKNNTSQTLTNLEPYTGVLVWQDRMNSTVILDSLGNVVKCYVGCASAPTQADYQAHNVTATSPGLSMSDGTGTLVLKGAIYQPRGAWYELFPGGTGVGTSPLQILTGMLTCGNGPGCGNTAVTLLGPTNNIVTYLPVLIQ